MITGASRGIGLATAKRLASQGHNLALFSRNMADTQLDWVEKASKLAMTQLSVTLWTQASLPTGITPSKKP